MENFNKNIEISRKLFLNVLNDNDKRISFLENCLNDENYFQSLNENDKSKIDEAINILISNAKIEETRKLQQAHFGPLIGNLRVLEGKEIANTFKNDENKFIDFLQIFVIFFFRKDIENENHSHDAVRKVLQDKCKEILIELKD